MLTVHVGQTKPLIFSTIPIIGIPVFLQNVISFITSSVATACGVVTIIAPSHLTLLKKGKEKFITNIFYCRNVDQVFFHLITNFFFKLT